MFKVASWNLNSVRSRLTHVTAWLKVREPDVLLLQELKGTEFPFEAFKSLGYESVAVTQKAYNGVAILSRHPMKTIAKALVGDDSDSHARFLETIINGIRIVNIYLPNGNPVGSDKFAYKLAWMDRLTQQMIRWKQDDVPTLIGGDFNVIPEDIDCHKPSSWEHDALFQPEPRARYRAMLGMGYTDAFRSLHAGEIGHEWFAIHFEGQRNGQERRAHKRERICPVSGVGSLSSSERKRRAREIIDESGADTLDHFDRVVRQGSVRTFRDQADHWLDLRQKRKWRPIAPSTIEDWERILKNWLNPHLGESPLSEVNNGALKRLVVAMSKADLSPKTMRTYAGVAKMVVASAVDAEGEQIYPRKWNHEFIDLPVVEKSKQNTPSFSSQVMSGLAKWRSPKERMLFILCGAAGFRIGEALGIEIDKHISSDFRTISLRQKARHCKVETRLKTSSALRDVDIDPAIASLLKAFVGDRKSGFLFTSRKGKPLSSSNIIRRHLHPALKELNYVNPHTGTHKAGNHAFRRFRNTYLKNYTDCPKGLYDYWLGHAGRDMSDLYDKVKEDVAFRKMWAEKSGFGFELPSVVPNVPKIAEETEFQKAA
jgi:exodeoxyribonuclease-3